jgi:predicted nucleic acid-binding protein
MSQDFIIKVRMALAKHKKNQAWLARQLNISDVYMSEIMRGLKKPNKQVERIELVLNELEKEEVH